MTGVIISVVRKREGQNGGFGFIRDAENQERFFHANNLRGVRFDHLEEGTNVEFKPVAGRGKGNGLSAEAVVVLA